MYAVQMKHDVVCGSCCFLHVRNKFHVFVSDAMPWRVTQATRFFLFSHCHSSSSLLFFILSRYFPFSKMSSFSLVLRSLSSSHFFHVSSHSLFLLLLCLFCSSCSPCSRCSLLLLFISFVHTATDRVDVCSDRFGESHACLVHVSNSQLLIVDCCVVLERCGLSHILWFPTRRCFGEGHIGRHVKCHMGC